MAKILLVYAPNTMNAYRVQDPVEHLGLLYLSSYARHLGHEVDVVDTNTPGMEVDDIFVCLHDYNIIGFTLYTSNMESSREIIRILRSKGYRGHITLGGHLVSLWPQSLSSMKGADSIVMGEGEETLCELASCIDAEEDWHIIPGTAFLEPGTDVVRTAPCRPLIKNLDFPFEVDRSIYESAIRDNQFAYVAASRGCTRRCSYCSVAQFYGLSEGAKWRPRSVERIADEIRSLVESFSVKDLTFVDDNFLPHKDAERWAVDLADRILDRRLDVKFNLEFKPRDIGFATLERLAKSGLNGVFLGLEAVTRRQQHLYRKKTDLAQFKTIVNYCKELAILPCIFTIFFDPWVTPNELRQSLDFVSEIGPEYFQHITWYLRPIPGTDLYDEVRNMGMLCEDRPICPGSRYYVNTMYEHPEVLPLLIRWTEIADSIEKDFIEKHEGCDKYDILDEYCEMKRTIFERCYGLLDDLADR